MVVIKFEPRRPGPRIERGSSKVHFNQAEVEFGLMQLSVELDEMLADRRSSAFSDLVRRAADLGAFEVLVQLRDLQNCVMRDDAPAVAAIYERIQRQIDADLNFVMFCSDPSGQSDR